VLAREWATAPSCKKLTSFDRCLPRHGRVLDALSTAFVAVSAHRCTRSTILNMRKDQTNAGGHSGARAWGASASLKRASGELE